MLLALAPRPRRDHIAITGIEIFAVASAGGLHFPYFYWLCILKKTAQITGVKFWGL